MRTVALHEPDEVIRVVDRHCAEVRDVLDQFARALLDGDGDRAAAAWDMPAFVVSDESRIALNRADELAEFFAGAAARYHAQGIADTRAEVEHLDVLTDVLVLVLTRWPYLDVYGQEEGCEYAQYLVRRGSDDRWRIVAGIMLGTCEPH
jgi:hypothetical protein